MFFSEKWTKQWRKENLQCIYNYICFTIIRIRIITVLSAISGFTLTLITIAGYGAFPAIFTWSWRTLIVCKRCFFLKLNIFFIKTRFSWYNFCISLMHVCRNVEKPKQAHYLREKNANNHVWLNGLKGVLFKAGLIWLHV